MRRKTMYKLTVSYPETLPDAVGSTQEQFELEAKWAMAVKLFEMKRLSAGMAAALIGVDQVTFLLKLADYGVAVISLSEAELLSDVANA
jgi:predicted HTH domain antitoxin